MSAVNITPAARPRITQEEAEQYILKAPEAITKAVYQLVNKGVISKKEADDYLPKALAQPIGNVKVIAIRGYYKDTMGKPGENDRGIYDDAFVVMAPNYFKTFNGNTDPRKYGFGVATLLPGLHYFKPGPHGFAHGPYPAFRTANPREVLPVTRDGQKGIKEGVTINMHSGGHVSTNSIACQTVPKGQWLEYQQDIYKLLKDAGQQVLPYLLTVE